MSAGAKISVVALLAVTALAWALVATTPNIERPAPTAPEPAPEPVPEPVPASAPEPAPAPVAKPQPAPTTPPQPPTAPAPGALEDPERGNRAAEAEDPTAAAEAEADRHAARNTERYDAASDRFGTEPRDEAWASEQERTLGSLVNEASPGDLLDGIECKSSMCQVRVRFNALTTAGGVERLGPLVSALGPERVVRNEGPADQRVMVVYVPRDGHWPDVPTQDPALAAP